MRVEKAHEFIKDLTSVLRDLKLGLCLEDSILQTKSPLNRFDNLLHYTFHKKINEVNRLGGVIYGSTALKFYFLGKIPLLSEKSNEWKMIMDVDNFKNFYYQPINFTQEKSYTRNGIKISDKYLSKRILNVTFGEIPRYNVFGKYKIETLESILYRNLEIIKMEIKSLHESSFYNSVEISDSVEVVVKILSYYGAINQAALASLYEIDLDRMLKLLSYVIKFC